MGVILRVRQHDCKYADHEQVICKRFERVFFEEVHQEFDGEIAGEG